MDMDLYESPRYLCEAMALIQSKLNIGISEYLVSGSFCVEFTITFYDNLTVTIKVIEPN
jgi:hypothetical protein